MYSSAPTIVKGYSTKTDLNIGKGRVDSLALLRQLVQKKEYEFGSTVHPLCHIVVVAEDLS